MRFVLLFNIVFYSNVYCQIWDNKSTSFFIGVGDNYLFKEHVQENKNKYTSSSTAGMGSITIKSTPSIFVRYEHKYNDNISVCIQGGYRNTEIVQTIQYVYYASATLVTNPTGTPFLIPVKVSDVFTFNIHDFNLAGRVNYHFTPNKRFDPYIGVALGYRYFNRNYTYTTDNLVGIYYVVEYENVLPIYASATVGVKYLLTNDLGVYLDVGIDKFSTIQGGVVFKIN